MKRNSPSELLEAPKLGLALLLLFITSLLLGFWPPSSHAQVPTQRFPAQAEVVLDKTLIKQSIYVQAKYNLVVTNQEGATMKSVLSAPSVITLPDQEATVSVGKTFQPHDSNHLGADSGLTPIHLGLQLTLLPSVEGKAVRLRGRSIIRESHPPGPITAPPKDPLKQTLLIPEVDALVRPDPADGTWTLAVDTSELHFNALGRDGQSILLRQSFPKGRSVVMEIEISAKLMP